MKISKNNKMLLFEQEFLSLFFVIVLGLVFNQFKEKLLFYLVTLTAGFIIYFWMIYEEGLHKVGKKHAYFEHTSSYLMIAQTALALELVSLKFGVEFLIIIFMVIAVIMYSVSLARVCLFKLMFRKESVN